MLPSKLKRVDQNLKFAPRLAVRTISRQDGMRLRTEAAVENRENRPHLIVRVTGLSRSGGWLAAALRPYNPEGIQFIESIEFEAQPPQYRVNGEATVVFNRPPGQVLFSDYHDGDVIHKIGDMPTDRSGNCEVGMATSAALFELAEDVDFPLEVSVSLVEELERENRPAPPPQSSWQTCLAESARLQVPDSKIRYL
jgi:hypothetical protein